jgi:hypothetical protein
MKKSYESFGTVQIKLIPRKDNENIILVKDVVDGPIICSKHINYISKLGMNLYELYNVEYGVYTNERGYIEMDFMKVYSYNQVTAGKSAPILAKNPKTTANKPAWLK